MVWIVLGGVVLVIILIFLLSRKTRESFGSAQDKLIGLCNYAMEISVHKQRNIDAILKLFEGKQSLTNEEIRTGLGVSKRSVVRYMDQLEKQGRVKQTGTTGRGISYRPS